MEFTWEGFRNDDDKKLWAIQVPQTDSSETHIISSALNYEISIWMVQQWNDTLIKTM